MTTPARQNTMNYLVPASGSTSGAVVRGFFTDVPVIQDWRNQNLDGEQYVPSGVFMDNSRGIGPLTMRVQNNGYSVTCQPGETLAAQYPAPLDQITEITGDGEASVIFVNFPVLPFVNSAPKMTDVNGAALPANFESLARTYDYSVPNLIIETATQTTPFPASWTRVAVLQAGTDKPLSISMWERNP